MSGGAAGRLTGLGVSPGVGYGPAYLFGGDVPEPPAGQRHAGEAGTERERAARALEAVAADLEARGERAGGEAGQVLAAQAMMARDPVLAADVAALIDAGTVAARAVFEAFGKYRDLLRAAGGYLGERAADLEDVRDRVVAFLTGHALPVLPVGAAEPYVLVARDLAPADTALLTREAVAGFVTEEGGPTSHTAILARAMGVPAVVALEGAAAIPAGARVLVDGSSGEVVVEPDDGTVARVTARARKRGTALVAAGPGRTLDGHPVPLLANVGGPGDVEAALAAGAEGVGLYRTEFLYLDRRAAPSEQEQEKAYREVLRAFPGRPVVVRTLDAGADKALAFLPPGREPNPALGQRGVRLSGRHPAVLAAQLRALAAAAAGTNARLQVMAPMVATVEEAEWFAAACRTAGLSSAGVMIEIPAAALRAADLAPAADFFSVGTNDLAQYAFAADRQVAALRALHDHWQPALLDLVALAMTGHDRPCGVCGEAAADPAMACVLAGLGAASLSAAPAALPAVRAALAAHTLEQCRTAARAARAAATAARARQAARRELPGLADLGL
ncbi:phosphoenolpyruvate--protein phosphotransferase [Thermoactinospora rubra]|uniref:phosphoenolpyruvate--protein phosphotransferase n=1 Tax=Thermoactinospora rubra TaxID=1088767 RepID=UPI000A11AAD3|nr:phosphoenolpyruvate--protein phosphotransferase [Thermoactinospora rubra]